MNHDTKAIVINLSLILLLAIGVLTIVNGVSALSLFVLLPIGIVIGPYMALTFPFSITFKIVYIAVLTASFISIILGIKFKHTLGGRLLTTLGTIVWLAAGLVGLGTGT